MKNQAESSSVQQLNDKTENAEPTHFLNRIDGDFSLLMDFIKSCDVSQMKDAIKSNLNYFKNTNKLNYAATVDYYNKYKLWGVIDPESGIYELADNRAIALVEHRQDFEWLYSRLCDFRSKRILTNILSYWLTSDYQKICQIQDKVFHQYFDLDLVQCNKEEVFVDIGAYIGDTMVDYINTFGADCYKRIYCYEIVPQNIEYILKNIELFSLKNVIIREKGAGCKSGNLFISDNTVSSVSKLSENGEITVPVAAIDDDIDEPVTFIKMDIEGAEEEALMGCQKKIAENHPKLALSVYHNHKDLWKLARIIDETDPTYRFYLRYHGEALLPTEYLLYAI
jgi:FkbM family methyltransferase